MPDFMETDNIELRYNADNWGPFKFDFGPLMTTLGTSLTGATIRVFSGKVGKKDDLSTKIEITSEIVESGTEGAPAAAIINGEKVSFYLKYPSSSTLKGTKATIVCEITTAAYSGKNAFFMRYVKIY